MSVVVGVSVAHGDAEVEAIESAAAGETRRIESLLAEQAVEEAFALETCNRAEAYVVTGDPAAGQEALADEFPEDLEGTAVFMDHEESLRHLLRVAAGLESLVLGEDQILGQFRDAYETARGIGALGPVLEEALTKAIHVGERARTETAVNEGAVSLGGAAVELAAERRDLASATALVVGAGEMARLAAQRLAGAGVEELVVANRTLPHAEHVAEETDADARAVHLDDLDGALAAADLAVTATGSDEPVIDAAALEGAGETLVIDIAQPRDVSREAAAVEGIELLDLDALEAVAERTRRSRRESAEAVADLVDEEFERLLDQFKRNRADDVIATMYESAERVKERELETAIAGLEAGGDLSEDQREVVESLADALVGQLLAAPTKSLREAAAEDDWKTIHTALQLFDPEFGPEAPDPEAPDRPAELPDGVPEELPEDADPPPFVDAGDEE